MRLLCGLAAGIALSAFACRTSQPLLPGVAGVVDCSHALGQYPSYPAFFRGITENFTRISQDDGGIRPYTQIDAPEGDGSIVYRVIFDEPRTPGNAVKFIRKLERELCPRGDAL